MTEVWVRSPEAANIMKCTPEALCRAVRVASKSSPVRVRSVSGGQGVRAHKLYCKQDLVKAAAHRVKATPRKKSDQVKVQNSSTSEDLGGFVIGHPAMLKPWNLEGMKA